MVIKFKFLEYFMNFLNLLINYLIIIYLLMCFFKDNKNNFIFKLLFIVIISFINYFNCFKNSDIFIKQFFN